MENTNTTIIVRDKDISTGGNGYITSVRVVTPDGRKGWAGDVAENITGEWHNYGTRKHERTCSQQGDVPVGSIVIEFCREIKHGQKVGPSTVKAFIAGTDTELRTKGYGLDLQVFVDGELVSIQ